MCYRYYIREQSENRVGLLGHIYELSAIMALIYSYLRTKADDTRSMFSQEI